MMTSKNALIERNEQLSRENALLTEAINAIATGESVHIGRKGDYTVSLVHPDWAHGGIVLVRFAPKGQRAMHTPHLFEDWFRWVNESATYSPNEENLGLRSLAEQCQQVVRKVQASIESEVA